MSCTPCLSSVVRGSSAVQGGLATLLRLVGSRRGQYLTLGGDFDSRLLLTESGRRLAVSSVRMTATVGNGGELRMAPELGPLPALLYWNIALGRVKRPGPLVGVPGHPAGRFTMDNTNDLGSCPLRTDVNCPERANFNRWRNERRNVSSTRDGEVCSTRNHGTRQCFRELLSASYSKQASAKTVPALANARGTY
ncbi:hypothetical protein PVAR5_8527 [Paecilomyces variotii No. 5]|uniref:Uncharacterized protein n=1 Tax=Byssochlamys spectabilis (strain No. 5 / NBRC 109023) TaxID=1356009 RepID=V5I5Y9_BYSSN|nr:hypothetical protein PVAR5_8527 [Paecilomyces variotii No. 5]